MGKAVFFFFIVLMSLAGESSAQKYDDTAIICKGSCVRFINIDGPGSLPSVSWEWFIPTGGDINHTTGSPSADLVCFPDTGYFEVLEIATFSNGDTSHRYSLVRVLFNKVQPIPIKDTSSCGNITVKLDAGNANLGFRYQWSTGPKDTTRFLTVSQPGNYTVRVYNKCDDVSKTITITKVDPPVVDLGPDGFICNDDPRLLDAGNPGCRYNWQPTGDTTQTIFVSVSGIYTVKVTNASGCSAQDDIMLRDSCPPTIFIPNAFKPDGDGLNDVFKAYYTGMKTVNMVIYSRWGEKLYEETANTDLPMIGWDGVYRGKVAENGVYMYIVHYLASNEQRQLLKGTFHLER